MRRTRPTRRPLAGLVGLVLGASVALGLLSPSSSAHTGAASAPASYAAPSAGHESQFVDRINSLRASRGLSQLQVSGELVGVARGWTEQMVQAGQISHNPSLGSQVSGDWAKLGENVGVGYDVDGLMQAFIDSAPHLANLVDPEWTHVGVGVTLVGDGRMYTTHNFMELRQSAPPPPPPGPAAAPAAVGRSAPQPAPTTTTTTAPAPPPAPAAPSPPAPEASEDRVTAVLDPLRSLEQG